MDIHKRQGSKRRTSSFNTQDVQVRNENSDWSGKCVLLRQERRVSRKDAKIGAKAAKQALQEKKNSRMPKGRIDYGWGGAATTSPTKQIRRVSFFSDGFFAPIFASLRETLSSRDGGVEG